MIVGAAELPKHRDIGRVERGKESKRQRTVDALGPAH